MYLLFDIGGTNMRIAVSHDGTALDNPVVRPTPPAFRDGLLLLEKTAKELSDGQKIDAVAGGIAGPMNRERTHLLTPPNMPLWANAPIKKAIEKAFSAPMFFENDAALAGLGEAVHGAGKGKRIVAYLTVSTGIGGARIVEERIDNNALGFEPGHQIVDASGKLCPTCAGGGILENLASGTATEKRFKKKPYDITDTAVWDELAQWLAFGLNNVTVLWSSDIIILGGPMVLKKPGIDVEDVRRHLKTILTIFPNPPEVVEASLGDFGGLYGALAYLKQVQGRE